MTSPNRAGAALVAVAAVAFAACGGSTATGSGGSSGSGGTSGAGGAAGSGGTTAQCPASPPQNGASCTPPWSSSGVFSPDAHCTWGNDPRYECRTTAICTNGAWQVSQPPASACNSSPLPPACPASPPADQTACSNAQLGCWYGDGTNCWCSGCAGGSEYPICQTINPPEWFCAGPAAGCPKTLPNAGTPCSVPGANCSGDCNLEVTCKDGVWQWLKGECPICAAPNTPIATPSGERAIADLRVGDLVYSVDHDAVVAVPLLAVGHTQVHAHHVMRVVLDDGRVLEVSPGHPTADGRSFGELRAGSWLDSQHRVVSAELVPYRYAATYDILPASSTGTYFAAGALIGSTLREREDDTADAPRGPAACSQAGVRGL